MQALFKVANMANPTQTYSKIQQGIKEPYLQFIERLQDAMEKQITNIEARNHLILQLARDNANEDCQKIIELLPNESLSLNDMINACSKVGSHSHNMILLADSIAAAVRASPQYYKCGQQGRLKMNCPCKSASMGTCQGQRNLNINCNKCGKRGHLAKQCRSKFHANRHSLKDQGNGKPSTRRRCLMIQASPRLPVQACATSSQEELEETLEWMFPPSSQ